MRLHLNPNPHPRIQPPDPHPSKKGLVSRTVPPRVLHGALGGLGREGRVVRAHLVDLAPAVPAGAAEGELHVCKGLVDLGGDGERCFFGEGVPSRLVVLVRVLGSLVGGVGGRGEGEAYPGRISRSCPRCGPPGCSASPRARGRRSPRSQCTGGGTWSGGPVLSAEIGLVTAWSEGV